jgi:hypothetical protein
MGVDARLFVTSAMVLTEHELDLLAYRLGEAFGPKTFWIVRPEEKRPWRAKRSLERVDDLDAPLPDALPYLTILRVNQMWRYYGEGYERGPAQTIIAVARWLEDNVPQSQVWYGGDCDTILHLFDAATREDLWQIFSKHGGIPYESHFGGISHDRIPVPTCDLCHMPMTRFGIGAKYASFQCLGCGLDISTHDSGETWIVADKMFSKTGQPATLVDGVVRVETVLSNGKVENET